MVNFPLTVQRGMCSGDVAFRGLTRVELVFHDGEDRMLDKECGIGNNVQWDLMMMIFRGTRDERNAGGGRGQGCFPLF